MPGTYVENIILPSFIQLQGSGQRNTMIFGATADSAVITFPDGYMGSTGVISDVWIRPAYAYFRAIEGYTQFLYFFNSIITGQVHIWNACCYSSQIRSEATQLMLIEEPRVNLYAKQSYIEIQPISSITEAPDHHLINSAVNLGGRDFTPNSYVTNCYSTGLPVAIPNRP